jgi:hypothetical protein
MLHEQPAPPVAPEESESEDEEEDPEEIEGLFCGRTNLNYTGSSTRVHFRELQRASNGIIPWPVG